MGNYDAFCAQVAVGWQNLKMKFRDSHTVFMSASDQGRKANFDKFEKRKCSQRQQESYCVDV